MGDSRYQAQFWFARSLYLCNEIPDAINMFFILSNVKIDIRIKNEPRGKIRMNKTILRFTGTITEIELNYGYIKRDEIGDKIYFYRYHSDYLNWDKFKRRSRVNFIISFNYRGAVALDVKLDSLI